MAEKKLCKSAESSKCHQVLTTIDKVAKYKRGRPVQGKERQIDHYEYFLKTRDTEQIISPTSKLKLLEYSWPGNVRELFNVMERSILMAKNGNILDDVVIDAEEKPGAPIPGEGLADMIPSTWADFKRFKSGELKLRKEELERIFVQKLLLEHKGNISVSARHAGIDRRQFQDMIKSLGIDASLFRGREIES